MKKLIGPFTQILPLTNLPLRGPLSDDQLQVIKDGSILINNGWVVATGSFSKLRSAHPSAQIQEIEDKCVLLPGFIDSHTHICYAGTRAADYALRIQSKLNPETRSVWPTTEQTRAASMEELIDPMMQRIEQHLYNGITTIEIKSGYGLSVEEELKQLRAIKSAAAKTKAGIVATCYAASMLPPDFEGSESEYLDHLLKELLPVVQEENLAKRVGIVIGKGGFNTEDAYRFLTRAKSMGFDIIADGEQSILPGIDANVVSCGHIEGIKEKDIKILAKSSAVAVALPGNSMGLGVKYASARKLLDAGASLAIASDWNPITAPMGDLLMQAAVMGAAEKLTASEVFAGLSTRAAAALNLKDRGAFKTGMHAGLQAFPCNDYREILYQQGKLKPQILI